VFEHGCSTSGGVGVGLTIARTIARTRSWSIEVTDPEAFGSDEGGARVVVSATGAE
jgi:signal transduction histidine kinase